MPAANSFDYAIVRLVPHVEREEFINVGLILFCRTRRFLAARVHLDEARLAALARRLMGQGTSGSSGSARHKRVRQGSSIGGLERAACRGKGGSRWKTGSWTRRKDGG